MPVRGVIKPDRHIPEEWVGYENIIALPCLLIQHGKGGEA